MRLLHTDTLQFSDYVSPDDAPPYLIASHRWLHDEVTYQEFLRDHADSNSSTWKKAGMTKILRFCSYIRDWRAYYSDGDVPLYLWIDTCCINKDSSAELQEAITSMFQWYAQAWCCLAYLHDVGSDLDPLDLPRRLGESVWFTRGWTLQELLAPKTVIFLNMEWGSFGHKSSTTGLQTVKTGASVSASRLGISLNRSISQITDIGEAILWDYANVRVASIQERQSWMHKRQTTRREDRAYCMLGICEVFMPLNYGEGSNADKRLERKILKQIQNQNEASQFQPLSLSEKEQILNRAVFNWKSPEQIPGQLNSTSSPASHVSTENGLSLDGLKLITLLEVWLSHPGQDKFMASKWAKTPQQYEDLKSYLRQDSQQRFVLKLPPSGEPEGSYVTKRNLEDRNGDDSSSASSTGATQVVSSTQSQLVPESNATRPESTLDEWAANLLGNLEQRFQQTDPRSLHGSLCIPADKFVSNPAQLAALRAHLESDPSQRYRMGIERGRNNESELSRTYLYRRKPEPNAPRLRLVADVLAVILSRLDTKNSITLQDLLKYRELQVHTIMISEIFTCLRNDECNRFEVTPQLPPINHFFLPRSFRVRMRPVQSLAIQDEAPIPTGDCKFCQQLRLPDPSSNSVDATCDRISPTCTRCAEVGRECWYYPTNKCVWCTDMRKNCDREKNCATCAKNKIQCRYREEDLISKEASNKCVWCSDMRRDCDGQRNCATCAKDGIVCRYRENISHKDPVFSTPARTVSALTEDLSGVSLSEPESTVLDEKRAADKLRMAGQDNSLQFI